MANTEETLTFNVSQMFPCLRTQATYLEDAEFVSWKQKCFASFPFAHPYNIVSNIGSKCFCSSVSSFATALRDCKVRAAKDHGKKFRSKLAASFGGIVHFLYNETFPVLVTPVSFKSYKNQTVYKKVKSIWTQHFLMN